MPMTRKHKTTAWGARFDWFSEFFFVDAIVANAKNKIILANVQIKPFLAIESRYMLCMSFEG